MFVTTWEELRANMVSEMGNICFGEICSNGTRSTKASLSSTSQQNEAQDCQHGAPRSPNVGFGVKQVV